ncbi:MAG: serine hydrolase domain-containing protein, partial [Bacteroidota bacterium]
MKTTPYSLLALGVSLSLLLWFYHHQPAQPLVDTTAPTSLQDSLTDDPYGLDRFDGDLDSASWLPAVEVAGLGLGPNTETINIWDTVSLAAWEQGEEQLSLAQNPSELLPLNPLQVVRLVRPQEVVFPSLFQQLRQTSSFLEYRWEVASPLPSMASEPSSASLLLLTEKSWRKRGFPLSQLAAFAANHSTVVVYFGPFLPSSLKQLPAAIIHVKAQTMLTEAMVGQVLFGEMSISSKTGGLLANRLGHAPPESQGIDRRRLAKMDRYIASAIRRRALPGCQVMVVKSGKIVYDRSFGHHTYEKEKAVSAEALYDLASITKATATTLGFMSEYEAANIDLADRLDQYVDHYDRSGLKYLRIRHLLSHQTGLQPNLPILPLLQDQTVLSTQPTAEHQKALGQALYLRDDVPNIMWKELAKVRAARKPYFSYSVVNFLLLQKVLEATTHQPMDDYLETRFY